MKAKKCMKILFLRLNLEYNFCVFRFGLRTDGLRYASRRRRVNPSLQTQNPTPPTPLNRRQSSRNPAAQLPPPPRRPHSPLKPRPDPHTASPTVVPAAGPLAAVIPLTAETEYQYPATPRPL